jgi:hypothetical protein
MFRHWQRAALVIERTLVRAPHLSRKYAANDGLSEDMVRNLIKGFPTTKQNVDPAVH